jgi:aryl-alcohol dehydrogenase-like predicted oxidoreductase
MIIGLGTVQFGQEYGISNKVGKPSPKKVIKIIEKSYSEGVRLIDTAPVYNCEELLGNLLDTMPDVKIVTKTASFTDAIIGKKELNVVEETFKHSLTNLKREKIYGLLAHNYDNLIKYSGDLLWNRMVSFKTEGFVEKIGASVYTADQIDALLENYQLDIIQLPLNVLDQRLIKSGHLKKLKNMGVEIHARSIFLQGLLLMDPNEFPDIFEPIQEHLKNYHKHLERSNYMPLDAALHFALSIAEIDKVIVGVNTLNDLGGILKAYNSQNKIEQLKMAEFAISNSHLLNPSMWGTN